MEHRGRGVPQRGRVCPEAMNSQIQTAITSAYGSGWVSTIRSLRELNEALTRLRVSSPDQLYRAGVRTHSTTEAKARLPILNVVLPALDLGTLNVTDVRAAISELIALR